MIWAFIFSAPSYGFAKISSAELLTITENSFALYWETAQAQLCEIDYREEGAGEKQSQPELGSARRFHYLEVKGLNPGTTYYYQIRCGQEKSSKSLKSPEELKTMIVPKGKELFSFAILTDLHLKEELAGLILLPGARRASLTPGFKWRDPENPYWSFTNQNALARINQLHPDFTIINGDLTSWFTEEEFQLAKQMLDKLQMPYYPLRGNHDRQGREPEDWFKKIFQLEKSSYLFSWEGFLFIRLDSIRLKDGFEEISEEDWGWLEKTLKERAGMPAFIFTHYQVGVGAPGIKKEDQKRWIKILEENPQVLACFYGHQHGAKIQELKFGVRGVPQIIVPTAKEYPSGFALVRVFETGWVYNFYGTDCEECLEWRSITRGEYFGLAPWINGGRLEDRNRVYLFSEPIQRMIKR